MKIRTLLILFGLSGAARAERPSSGEVLIGAAPPVCFAAKTKTPPAKTVGAIRKVGPLLEWLAANTCKQYLIGRPLLGRVATITSETTAAELAVTLTSVLNSTNLVSRSTDVRRIVDATTPEVDEQTGLSAADLGIRCEGPHCTMSQRGLDLVLANPLASVSSARIVPSVKEGKPNGFKLYAIRPGSLWADLGFLNGDTLLAINGQSLDTADKALEVYSSLRRTKHFEISLMRRGVALSRQIDLVAP